MEKRKSPNGFIVVLPGEIIEIPQNSDKSWLTLFYSLPRELAEKWKPAYDLPRCPYEVLRTDKYDHIAKILNELRDYTKIHFQHEEEYMKSINYKGMFMQKVQHDQFCQKLDELDLEHLDENSEEVIQEVLTFLTDWLVHHILETDKKIAE